MLFSILIPSYNAEKYISTCIESIKKQKFHNWECIIIDDGSKNCTFETAKNIVDNDIRFILIKQKNQGVSRTRNKLLQYAKGDYIVWIDSDDFISDNMLQCLYRKILKYEADLYFFNYNVIEKNKIRSINLLESHDKYINKEKMFVFLAEECKMPSFLWNKVAKRSLYKDIIFDSDISMLEDYAIMTSLFSSISKVIYISEYLYNYRQIDSSITHNINSRIIKNNIKIRKKRESYIINNFPKLRNSINSGKVYVSIIMLPVCYEKNFHMLYKYFKKTIIKNIFYFLVNNRINLKYKIKALLLILNCRYYFLIKEISMKIKN